MLNVINMTTILRGDERSANQALVVAAAPGQLQYNRPAPSVENFLQTIGFIIAGLPLFIINLPIFGIIITNVSLRTNYMVLAFLILHNGLTGLNNTILGITRLVDLHRFTEGELIDNDRCLLHSSNFLVLLILLNGLGLLANSVDRLLVVTFPIQYFQHTYAIATALLGAIYAFALVFMATAMIIEVALPPRYISPLCLEQLVYAEDTYSVIVCVRTTAAAASIPIMIAVLVIMHKRKKTMIERNRKTSFANISDFIERQSRFTQTTLLSCSITFFLYVVPAVNQLIHDRLNVRNENEMALYAVFLTSINSYNLVIVFVYRQKDVRQAVWRLLTSSCSSSNKQPVKRITPSDVGRTFLQIQPIRCLSQSQMPVINVLAPGTIAQTTALSRRPTVVC